MSSTDIFFAIGHFLEWSFGIISKAEWSLPVIFIAVIMFGMVYWLSWEKRLTRRAKERDGFI